MRVINQLCTQILISSMLVACGSSIKEYRVSAGEFAFAVREKNTEVQDVKEFHNLILVVSRTDQQDLIDALNETYNESDLITYLSYRLKDDIKLKSGSDTVGLALYHFERSFDLKTSRTFNLTFEYQGRSFNETDALIIDSPLFDTQVHIPLVKKS